MTRIYADTRRIVDYTRIDAADVKAPIDALDTLIAEIVFTGGRLSLSSTQAVPTSSLSAQTTLYYLPYGGAGDCGLISLWNSTTSGINQIDFTGGTVSLSLAATSATTLYDVFGYINSGALALELLAWTSSGAGTSSRATALTWQNGLLCKSGDATRRYLGTLYMYDINAAYDTQSTRHLFNAYNRVPRFLTRADTTASWTYDTATWRASNNDGTGNKFDVVAGLDGTNADFAFMQVCDTTGVQAQVGIAKNGTTPTYNAVRDSTGIQTLNAALNDVMAAGYHTYTAVEYASAATVTFYGNGTMLFRGYVMG